MNITQADLVQPAIVSSLFEYCLCSVVFMLFVCVIGVEGINVTNSFHCPEYTYTTLQMINF